MLCSSKRFLGIVSLSFPLLLFVELVSGEARAVEPDGPIPADAQMLKAHGVNSDGASLVRFLAERSGQDGDLEHQDRLIEQLGSTRFAERNEASQRLVRLGPAAIRSLTKALKAPDVEAFALSNMGPRAAEAVPDLIRILQQKPSADPDWAGLVRPNVLGALSGMGAAAEPAVPALQALLADKSASYSERAGAAHALGKIGPAAKSAIPVLERATREKDVGLMVAATMALENIRRN